MLSRHAKLLADIDARHAMLTPTHSKPGFIKPGLGVETRIPPMHLRFGGKDLNEGMRLCGHGEGCAFEYHVSPRDRVVVPDEELELEHSIAPDDLEPLRLARYFDKRGLVDRLVVELCFDIALERDASRLAHCDLERVAGVDDRHSLSCVHVDTDARVIQDAITEHAEHCCVDDVEAVHTPGHDEPVIEHHTEHRCQAPAFGSGCAQPWEKRVVHVDPFVPHGVLGSV